VLGCREPRRPEPWADTSALGVRGHRWGSLRACVLEGLLADRFQDRRKALNISLLLLPTRNQPISHSARTRARCRDACLRVAPTRTRTAPAARAASSGLSPAVPQPPLLTVPGYQAAGASGSLRSRGCRCQLCLPLPAFPSVPAYAPAHRLLPLIFTYHAYS